MQFWTLLKREFYLGTVPARLKKKKETAWLAYARGVRRKKFPNAANEVAGKNAKKSDEEKKERKRSLKKERDRKI